MQIKIKKLSNFTYEIIKAASIIAIIITVVKLNLWSQNADCYSFDDCFDKGYNSIVPELQIKYHTKAIKKWGYYNRIENKAAAYNNRGLAYHDKKQYDKAIEDYNKAIELNPKDAMAYNNRGSAYSDKKQYDKAIEDYNKAIELNPEYAMAYNNRGVAYSDKKQYDKAIEDYNKAIKLDNDPRATQYAYINRGITYSYKKQYDKAIEDYNKAIELNPEYADAYSMRGAVYSIFGKVEKGKEDFENAVKKYSSEISSNTADSYSYNNRGWAYLWLGKCEAAKSDFEKSIELDKNDFFPYDNMGIYWWYCKCDKKTAIKWFEKAFKLGFDRWDELYDETSAGHFIKGLNNSPEFKALVKKYKKDSSTNQVKK